ncbi:MAG: hypothetical protein Dasosvirus4_4 [Dasosvirus sp.]|uniref:Uncharacterized protein n=1 Tax=Dasosvirus sp. TaxID=2487764 RepID=A0A3G4ZV44_9VIRU|nr:MAG: hypothetical protein Dasosvirus4_4 [Dasosvirus sp.]
MYLYLHQIVRNDEHCPVCRRHVISLYKTLDEACNEAMKDINDRILKGYGEKDNNYLYQLEKGWVIWIDEWERRRNGDKYQVFKLSPYTIYNLNEYDSNESKQKNDKWAWLKYLFLQIKINKSQYCPDNIIFSASFHATLISAKRGALEFLRKLEINDDELFGDDLKQRKDEVEKDIKEHIGPDLFAEKPIWINNDYFDPEEDNGNYYQIIKIKYNKKYYLNSFCEQLKPKRWIQKEKEKLRFMK